MKMEKIKIFEMFAGYGGASFALKKAGIPFECVGYSEIDKSAIKCYEQNHPNIKNYKDCSKINPEDLPDFDLLTGGFPCQDVSIAGKRDLSKGRTLLVNHIFRIIKVKKPTYLVLENVEGLIYMESLWKSIQYTLRNLGYGVSYKLLNSKDYGIPQNRPRLWIVCKYGGWDFMEFMYPEKEKLNIKVRDILEKDIIRSKIKNKRLKEILNSPKSEENGLLFELINDTPSGLSRQGDRIYSLDISPCLNCVLKEYLFYDNGEVISLTPKECFRLMGFLNDEISLDDLSNNQKYKLSGNGWDINVVSKIFTNLLKNNGGFKKTKIVSQNNTQANPKKDLSLN